MFADLIHLHQNDFQTIAEAWIRVGAQAIRLVEHGEMIASMPKDISFSKKEIIGRNTSGSLELHIHGMNDGAWQSIADAMTELFSHVLTTETEMEELTASLVETQDKLVALYELTQSARRALKIDDLLDLLIQESRRLLDADGAFTAIYFNNHRPQIRQSAIEPLPEAHLHAASTIYRKDTRRHNFKDSMTLPRGLSNVIMSTLPVRENVFACIGVFNKTGDFTSHDIKLLRAIAEQSGAQIDNALLYQEALARTRFETEMDLARQVQIALLPQSIPTLDGLDIYGASAPASQVGGDFFDIIARKGQPLVFMLGDITGKGMPAALLMTMTRTTARSAARNMPFSRPDQIVKRLNTDLLDDFSTVSMFSTAFIGTFDPVNRSLLFSNAGQSPILFMPVQGEPQLLEAQDIPIGIFEDYEYISQTLSLVPGDVLVAATDGFNESRNNAGEMFGMERMLLALKHLRGLSARGIADGLFKAVNNFSEDHPQDDDRTIIVLKVSERMESVSFQIPAGYEDLRIAAKALRELLMLHKVQESVINNCELAMQELLSNIVEHSYSGNKDKMIEVRLQVDGKRLIIETRDSGIPANIKLESVAMPDPLELQVGGYGMAIIQALMDEVQHQYKNEKNLWTLTKKI